jgi:protein disulfide-isomerase A1
MMSDNIVEGWKDRGMSLSVPKTIHDTRLLTRRSLVPYVNRFLELPLISPISKDSISNFKRNGDTVAVGYIAIDDGAHQGQFRSLANAMHPVNVFGISHDLELAKSEGVNPPTIAVYGSRRTETSTISISTDTKQMELTLRKASRPLFIDLAFNTHDDILDVSKSKQCKG